MTLLGLTRGASTVVHLGSVTVRAGSAVTFDLASVLAHAPRLAVQVSATGPVLTEQLFTPIHGVTTAVGGIPGSGAERPAQGRSSGSDGGRGDPVDGRPGAAGV